MKRSAILSLLFILATALWILSGSFGKPAPEKAPSVLQNRDAEGGEEKIVRVGVTRSQSQAVASEIAVNGRTKAARVVELLAEAEGRVIEVPVSRGAAVAEGDVIARIEIRDRKALVAKARQDVKQREIEYAAAQGLSEKGYNSKVRLAGAEAALEAARAELKRAAVELENTEIRAPFAGVLEDRAVEIGSFVQIGTVAAKIVDLDPLRVTGYVSEQRISGLKTGNPAFVTLTDGREAKGKISYIATTADAATRTFLVEIEISNPGNAIIEGLTARLRLPVAAEKAHRISPAILSLDDAGIIGVKTVDVGNVVQFVPVTLEGDAPTGVWVRGLPDDVLLITAGQEYATPGQKVDPVAEGAFPPEKDKTAGPAP